jgi:hypothetical protein
MNVKWMRGTLAACACSGLLACGNGANPAQTKVFTYGSPTAATSTQTAAAAVTVGGVTAMQGSPNASSSTSFADTGTTTNALLGANGTGFLTWSPAHQNPQFAEAHRVVGGLVRAAATNTATNSPFSNPACVTQTSSSITLNNCTATLSGQSTGGSSTVTLTANGDVKWTTGANASLDWNLTMSVTTAGTANATQYTGSANANESGHITAVTASGVTTVNGDILAQISVTASSGSQSATLGVAEAVDLTNITYVQGCITGGTLEAKRVWTSLPAGATAAQFPDKGAKVTWTSCGNAAIAISN